MTNVTPNVSGIGSQGSEDKPKVSPKSVQQYKKRNFKKFTEFLRSQHSSNKSK